MTREAEKESLGFAVDAEAAYLNCARGDCASARRVLKARAGAEWRAALEVALWLQEGGVELRWEPFVAGRAGSAHADALGRAAFVAFDGPLLTAIDAALLDRPTSDPYDALVRQASAVRCQLLGGHYQEAERAAAELAENAHSLQQPAMLVDATSYRALAELSAGSPEAGLTTARRAARMARTEGLPQSELLSNLVLARARRFANRPHLAIRILTALGEFAPDAWLPWIRWELILAGAPTIAVQLHTAAHTPGALAASELDRLLSTVTDANDVSFSTSLEELRQILLSTQPFLQDAEQLGFALSPTTSPALASTSMLSWAAGDGQVPPFGLMGLALVVREAGDDVIAYAVGAPGRKGRRIFGRGSPLGPTALGSAKPGRLETALAVLLLAQRPLSNPDLFRAIYGFEYKREIHQGPFEVLLHRVRKLVGNRAELNREPSGISLGLHAPLSIPDPRCTKPLDERLLSGLAIRRGGSAKDMAKALGVPLRTVQTAMRALTEEGACTVEKQGRAVVYRVEDTTFSEPTMRKIRRQLISPDASRPPR